MIKDGTGDDQKRPTTNWTGSTEVENGNKEVVKYEYNLGNEITKITYPNTKSITRAFDKAGRLEKITDWLSKETKFAYNRDSALKTTTFPSASEQQRRIRLRQRQSARKTTTLKEGGRNPRLDHLRARQSRRISHRPRNRLARQLKNWNTNTTKRERLIKGAGTSFEYDAANNPTKLGATNAEIRQSLSSSKEAGSDQIRLRQTRRADQSDA